MFKGLIQLIPVKCGHRLSTVPTPYLLVESLYEKVSFELQYSFLYEFEILQYLSV